MMHCFLPRNSGWRVWRLQRLAQMHAGKIIPLESHKKAIKKNLEPFVDEDEEVEDLEVSEDPTAETDRLGRCRAVFAACEALFNVVLSDAEFVRRLASGELSSGTEFARSKRGNWPSVNAASDAPRGIECAAEPEFYAD